VPVDPGPGLGLTTPPVPVGVAPPVACELGADPAQPAAASVITVASAAISAAGPRLPNVWYFMAHSVGSLTGAEALSCQEVCWEDPEKPL
jgi:hypothetical protein